MDVKNTSNKMTRPLGGTTHRGQPKRMSRFGIAENFLSSSKRDSLWRGVVLPLGWVK